MVSGGADESFELVVQCRGTGLPTVFYFHELNTLRRLKTPALLDGVAFVANSAYTARAVLDVLGRGAAVVPPLVDREAYRLTSTRRHVTMVNPRRIKGGQTAFDLARACPDIPFTFVEAWHTKDEFVRRLRAAARAMPNVTWRKPTLDMRSIYASTRILLAPSEWEETWGRVVTEAHAAGIPVLARAYAGLPESVGTGGILMAPDASLAEWTQALRSMWDDHALYEVLVERTCEFSARAGSATRLPRRGVHRGAAGGGASHTFHGQSPRASMRSKVILSLKVSMHCQKPSQRKAMSLRCSISRANGCSTSSSPSRM